MPWGHIAGKWWGPKNERPILCIHGWQDNAATYDNLIPMLPQHVGYLAIDLPGHGFSSRIPDGMSYNNFDFVVLFEMIRRTYGWEKLSIMGHSLGGILAFIYAGLNSKYVDMLVGIDGFIPSYPDADKQVASLRRDLDTFMLADERNRSNSEPPAYDFEEAVEKLHIGTFKSVSKESAPALLARGLAKSEIHPDKFYYTRDNRLKSNFATNVTSEVAAELIKHIVCPYQFLRATRSPFYKGQREEIILEMQRIQPKFEYHVIEGKHHLHLNDPKSVSGLISDFILRHRPPHVESKL